MNHMLLSETRNPKTSVRRENPDAKCMIDAGSNAASVFEKELAKFSVYSEEKFEAFAIFRTLAIIDPP